MSEKPGRPPKYPFARMQVGEVCFVASQSPRHIYRRVQDHVPKRFKCRQVMFKGELGVKVERVQ